MLQRSQLIQQHFQTGGKFWCFFRAKMVNLFHMSGGSKLHIAVEGCVGVGKTTLATKLADFRKATLVLEEFEKNPFLDAFYSDPKGNVFETELQFLLLHFHQLKALPSSEIEIITDFTFMKDSVFGESNFHEGAEKGMFIQLYQFLLARLPVPDLIIYLKGSEELIIDRIRRRNRPIEQTIDVEYFKKLKIAYDEVFLRSATNVHVIDADHFDCLNDPTALDNICSVIDSVAARASKP